MRTAHLISLLLALSGTAAADPLDSFGFGARASAMAGAVVADAHGAAAAHANPAGVVMGAHPELTIGWGYGLMALSINGTDTHENNAHGIDLGFKAPIRIGGIDTAFGVALYLPDQFVARIQLVPATEPHFVLLGNDVHRIVAEPVYSVRPFQWLAIGAGASILADVAGNGITFNVGVVGGQKVGEGALDVSVPTRVAPLAGVLIMPTPRVRVGLAYRGELDLSLKLAILANVDVAGVVTGDALIDIRAANFFTPRKISVGAAVDVTPHLTVSGEVAFLGWSEFHGGAPDLRILVALGITPPLVQTLFPEDTFHDTIAPRAGLEYRLQKGDMELGVRGGIAYEPSPVPPQVGLTSFADNDRLVLATGAGIKFRTLGGILTRPIAFDVAVQWHHLRDKLTIKDQEAFPGGAFSSQGEIARASATMSVEF